MENRTRTFDDKVLHRSRPWLGIRWVTTTWYDENDLPLAGRIKDILPDLGAQGWEVCGVGSGGTPVQFLAFMVILKRERTSGAAP